MMREQQAIVVRFRSKRKLRRHRAMLQFGPEACEAVLAVVVMCTVSKTAERLLDHLVGHDCCQFSHYRCRIVSRYQGHKSAQDT